MKATAIPQWSRDIVRERAAGRCERCGSPNPVDWHHRRSRSVRAPNVHSPSNGLSLCRTCHSWCHKNPVDAREQGSVVSRYADPETVPFLRWDGAWVLLGSEGGVTFTDSSSLPSE